MHQGRRASGGQGLPAPAWSSTFLWCCRRECCGVNYALGVASKIVRSRKQSTVAVAHAREGKTVPERCPTDVAHICGH